MPKGQRPPPFGPPPTTGSYGCEAWGDPAYIGRLIRRYSEILERVTTLQFWSIEVLGLKSDLEFRYTTLVRETHRHIDDAIHLAHAAACSRCDRLELEFFAKSNEEIGLPPPAGEVAKGRWGRSSRNPKPSGPLSDAIILSIEGGWLGSSDANTPQTILDVRSQFLEIYNEVEERKYGYRTEGDLIYSREVCKRINSLLDQLFSITGPDEIDYTEWVEALSDSARVIKERAFKHTSF